MAINVSIQYNVGLLPDMMLLTQCYYHWSIRLNAMKMFCPGSLCSHLNVLKVRVRSDFSLNTTSDLLRSNEKCPVRSAVTGRP